MKNEIEIGINAPFDLDHFNENKSDDVIKSLKKIKSITCLYKSDLNNKDKFDIVLLDSKLEKNTVNKNNQNDELIYEIKVNNNEFKVLTGKYIGNLIVDGIAIRINSGYGKFFEKRLLDYSNGLYFDNSLMFNNDDKNDELSLLIQYLFLTSLKRANVMGFPKEYKTTSETNFYIKGQIDLNQYIKNYKNNYKGINYKYRTREYNKDILNTIYKAFSLCNKKYITSSFKDLNQSFCDIKDELNKNYFNNLTIEKAKKSTVLNNQMYSPYKRVLSYAEMLILHKGFLPTPEQDKKIARGWLIDIADLWELYLYQLIKIHFLDWEVFYQEEIPIYPSLFFGRKFMPDIIMKKNNDIVIIDAKFKKMDFNTNGNDVDRADLQQSHTYFAYYYSNGFNVKFTTLIYPTKNNPNQSKKMIDNVFSSNINSKFGISYLVVGNDKNEQIKNEEDFINRLKKEIYD